MTTIDCVYCIILYIYSKFLRHKPLTCGSQLTVNVCLLYSPSLVNKNEQKKNNSWALIVFVKRIIISNFVKLYPSRGTS